MDKKWCFVPGCKNTSKNAPRKIFVTVPKQTQRKIKWFKAARRELPTTETVFYCCEDHFKLEEDMDNYIRYKLMGGPIFIKQHVIPHLFECQPDRKRAVSSQDFPLAVRQARKNLILHKEEALTSTKNDNNAQFNVTIGAESSFLPESSTSGECNKQYVSVDEYVPTISVIENIRPIQKDVAIQVRPHYRSKYVMCKLGVSTLRKDKASSPVRFITSRDVGTSPIPMKCAKITKEQLVAQSTSSSEEKKRH